MEKVNVNENLSKVNVNDEEIVLKVVRESFIGTNKEKYWSYMTKGKVRDRDIRVDFAPKDKGGYEPLDIVFDVSPNVDLIMTEEEMTNEKTGKTTKYTSYKVRSVDEYGIEYECAVKPARDSDKALLTMLVRNKRLELMLAKKKENKQ